MIRLLADIVGKSGINSEGVILGIGDDAAAWHGDDRIELATTDTMVQGVHFTLDTTTWWELGWKALASNLSDIAAMGGRPGYALVSLALPGDTEVESVAELYRGMVEIAREFDVSIVGGDVIASPIVVITIALVGSAEHPDRVLTRSGALPGERIAVTGYPGSSAGGLKMLGEGLGFDQETTDFLREAHLRPRPRIVEGQALAAAGVRAAIDLSDGLLADLAKLCESSGVGAMVELGRVPFHPSLKSAFPEDYLDLALSGGEDYELLFTASSRISSEVTGRLGCPATIIGEIVADEPGRVRLIDEEGKEVKWEKGGWEHFAGGGRGIP